MAAPPPVRFSSCALVCGMLGALVLATRAWLIGAGGSPVPYWDQWDGEALWLYKPWLESTLTWDGLFVAHNEHRIVLTRLADLALLTAAGEWNLWWQLLLNATLHAATAALLVATGWPALSRGGRTALAVGVAVLFAAPADWHNALWGFQSAFYFSGLLAVIAFGALASGPPGPKRRIAGSGACLLSLFTTGGGVLTPCAAAAGLALRLAFPSPGGSTTPRGRDGLTLLALFAIVALGAWLHVVKLEHAAGKAQSVAQFLTVFSRCLAWPHVENGLGAIVLQLPLVAALVVCWRRRERPDAALIFAGMLVASAVLQAAAVAYSRGGTMPLQRPISRYFGPLVLGASAQWLAALWLAEKFARRGRLAALGWAGAVAFGVMALTTLAATVQLPYQRTLNRVSYDVARRYLLTHDRAAFGRDATYPMLHPDPLVAAQVIDDPVLRPILPAALRLGADAPAAAPPWLVRHAVACTLATVALFMAALAIAWRRDQTGRTRL